MVWILLLPFIGFLINTLFGRRLSQRMSGGIASLAMLGAFGVSAVQVSRLLALLREQPPEWREGWENQPELPRLIRLRVRFAENDEREWPELIVRPMLDRAPTFGF